MLSCFRFIRKSRRLRVRAEGWRDIGDTKVGSGVGVRDEFEESCPIARRRLLGDEVMGELCAKVNEKDVAIVV